MNIVRGIKKLNGTPESVNEAAVRHRSTAAAANPEPLKTTLHDRRHHVGKESAKQIGATISITRTTWDTEGQAASKARRGSIAHVQLRASPEASTCSTA